VNKHLMALACVSVVGLFTAGSAAAQEVIKIGQASPLTGGNAPYGKDLENAVNMAIDEANAQGIKIGGKPVKFEIDAVDDQADPRTGVTVAQQLVDDKVDVVIGHFNSGTTLPASKIYSAAGIPMITPAATNPAITQSGSKTIFSIIATDAQNAGNAGKYAVTVSKAKRIAVIDDRTAFGQGEADEFEKAVKAAKGTLVAHEYTDSKAVDFSAQLTHIKSLDADMVFFAGLNPQAALVAKKMKQLGMKAQLVGGGGVMEPTFLSLAGDAAEGTMAWEYGQPLSSLPKGADFAAKYKAKFGTEMLSYAPFGYDATWAAIKAMEAAKSTKPSAYVPMLRYRVVEGITGKIRFSATGALLNPATTLYVVKGGQWTVVTVKE